MEINERNLIYYYMHRDERLTRQKNYSQRNKKKIKDYLKKYIRQNKKRLDKRRKNNPLALNYSRIYNLYNYYRKKLRTIDSDSPDYSVCLKKVNYHLDRLNQVRRKIEEKKANHVIELFRRNNINEQPTLPKLRTLR